MILLVLLFPEENVGLNKIEDFSQCKTAIGLLSNVIWLYRDTRVYISTEDVSAS
jgi:hypothetical protein